MPLSADLREYAADLAFNGGDPRKGFALFEQFSDDCVDQYDYITMLQILAYAQGRTDPPRVYDFLEKCLKSEFEDVRKNASFCTAPRFLKTGKVGRERLLPILKHVSEADISESVRRAASAGLFMSGEISEEAFKSSHKNLQNQDV